MRVGKGLIWLELLLNHLSPGGMVRYCVDIPGSYRRINLLTDRFRDEADAHIKGFASEALVIIRSLKLFIDCVINPGPLAVILAAHLQCFHYLCLITDMLQTKSPRIADSLERAFKAHHTLFLQCYYAYNLAKQKLHYLAHIPDCIRRFNKVLTCFNAEATHRFSKRVMHSAYKHSHRTALSYDLHRMLYAACDELTYQCMYLLPRIVHICNAALVIAAMPSHVITTASLVTASRGIRHPRGTFKRGHMLVWHAAGVTNVCKARLFLAAKTGTTTEFFMWLDHWTSSVDADGRTLWSSSSQDRFISAELIAAVVLSVALGDKHLVYIPTYM